MYVCVIENLPLQSEEKTKFWQKMMQSLALQIPEKSDMCTTTIPPPQ
jgi:hypothetical protein